MAKKVKLEDIQTYADYRDDLLSIIKFRICKRCTDPQKNEKIDDCTDPVNCECRCDRVDSIISSAEQIDSDIKELLKTLDE